MTEESGKSDKMPTRRLGAHWPMAAGWGLLLILYLPGIYCLYLAHTDKSPHISSGTMQWLMQMRDIALWLRTFLLLVLAILCAWQATQRFSRRDLPQCTAYGLLASIFLAFLPFSLNLYSLDSPWGLGNTLVLAMLTFGLISALSHFILADILRPSPRAYGPSPHTGDSNEPF